MFETENGGERQSAQRISIPEGNNMPRFAGKPAQGIPRTIWALGLVSLFMEVSSALVHSLLLILADLLLAWAGSVITVLLGVALWRLHMGFSQGILAALMADTTPAKLKGSAFGLFNLVSGIAVLLASATATRPFANTVYRKSRPNLSRPDQFAVRQQSCLCCIFGPMLRQQPS